MHVLQCLFPFGFITDQNRNSGRWQSEDVPQGKHSQSSIYQPCITCLMDLLKCQYAIDQNKAQGHHGRILHSPIYHGALEVRNVCFTFKLCCRFQMTNSKKKIVKGKFQAIILLFLFHQKDTGDTKRMVFAKCKE